MNPDDFCAVDFETSYTKDRDIKTLGIVPYLRHPDTDIYRVAIVSGSGDMVWVGHPGKVRWDRLCEREWVSHNASFDSAVYRELCRRLDLSGRPEVWNCTADLCAYVQAPRALANAVPVLLGKEKQVNKAVRAAMKDRDFDKLSATDRGQVDQYTVGDSTCCAMIWKHESPRWPEHEREISRHTTAMGQRGIGFDREAAGAGHKRLGEIADEAAAKVPWAGHAAISSPTSLRIECERLGIEPPMTTEAKSDIFDRWADRYAGDIPFVYAVQKWRRANRLLRVIEAMQVRCVDERIRYNLKYFGAHTGRHSGDAGLNLQNFPREAFEGVDVRKYLVPAPGNVFVVGDLAQIEARVTLWLAEDEAMLTEIAGGGDLYESYARKRLGYADPGPMKEVDPRGRQMAKAIVLALGFGMGPARFVTTAKTLAGVEIDLETAAASVKAFREANPGITGLWYRFDRLLLDSVDGVAEVGLPSGRMLRYYDVREKAQERGSRITATVERRTERPTWKFGEKPKLDPFLWGGTLTENAVQAIARDILMDAVLRVEKAGMPVVLHVHDELIVEVPREDAQDAERAIRDILTTPPGWVEGAMRYALPLEAEVRTMERYGK